MTVCSFVMSVARFTFLLFNANYGQVCRETDDGKGSVQRGNFPSAFARVAVGLFGRDAD